MTQAWPMSRLSKATDFTDCNPLKQNNLVIHFQVLPFFFFCGRGTLFNILYCYYIWLAEYLWPQLFLYRFYVQIPSYQYCFLGFFVFCFLLGTWDVCLSRFWDESLKSLFKTQNMGLTVQNTFYTWFYYLLQKKKVLKTNKGVEFPDFCVCY